MADVWYLSQDDDYPELTGTLQYESAPDVWVVQDLTGAIVTLTLYRSTGAVYKANAAVTVVGAPTNGDVSYAWAAADSQQGTLTGKCRVTFANGKTRSFPNTGHFQIRVSR
jgi:hypothetical protein